MFIDNDTEFNPEKYPNPESSSADDDLDDSDDRASWEAVMSEMGDFEDREAVESQPAEIQEANSVDSMRERAEADGYTPRAIGEQSVLSVNQDGKIRIESEYRNIWNTLSASNPGLYQNVDNQAFSLAVWDLCNAAMLADLNPNDALEDQAAWRDAWDKCTKLHSLMDDPAYADAGRAFLDELSELGAAGESIAAVYDTVAAERDSNTPEPAETDSAPDETAEYYDQLNRFYDDIMSQPTLDSEEIEELIASYQAIPGYKDADARAATLQDLLDRLEAITSAVDD